MAARSTAAVTASSTQRAATTIMFDQSKREEFTIFTGFRLLHRHLRAAWNVEINNEELTDSTFDSCRIFVLPLPKAKFYAEELDTLRKFVHGGGSLLVLMSEGGEQRADTNINFLIEEFGIVCNPDSVIRTVFYKYFDPKEALISNGITNRAILAATPLRNEFEKFIGHNNNITGFAPGLQRNAKNIDDDALNDNQSAFPFVYPYGATLSVNRDSVVILSTGTVCCPLSRPICAFHNAKGGGRVAVIGSTHIFSDEYIEKEHNMKIFDVVLKYLSDAIELNQIDATNPELASLNTTPDHIQLSAQLKMCLQESEMEQSAQFGGVGFGGGDFTKLFDQTLCLIGLENWPECIRCYKRLAIPHEPLTLVSPVFEVPLPPLQPAIFPPNFREISPPQLELFDLDEAFSTSEIRLGQLTNRCNENELDLYIREAGELLGINNSLTQDEVNSKKILEHVIQQIIEYKKMGQDVELSPTYMLAAREDVSAHHHTAYENNNKQAFSAIHDDDKNYFSDIDEYDELNVNG